MANPKYTVREYHSEYPLGKPRVSWRLFARQGRRSTDVELVATIFTDQEDADRIARLLNEVDSNPDWEGRTK